MHDLIKKHGFDFQMRTRIIFGNNTIDRLNELVQELGGRRILLVSDQGVVNAGHVERACKSLEISGVHIVVFDKVRENPTTKDVERCLECARSEEINLIIGLGGGSSIDTAKGCNFLLTNGGEIRDYWGVGKAKRFMLPMIAIPTTAGTGSETQSFALIADEETHQKMACGDQKAAPKIALLDPTLTLTQPENVSICTGIDAIAHAIESAVTKPRNPISSLFAREAFQLTISSIDALVNDPDNLSARQRMLLGASYGGIAIENSMLGAAHAMANPLTAHYGIAHGYAVGLMLPWVVRVNCKNLQAKQVYADLAFSTKLISANASVDEAIANLIMRLFEIVKIVKDKIPLNTYGLHVDDVPRLAAEASNQWTASFNPCPVEVAEFENLYCSALNLDP